MNYSNELNTVNNKIETLQAQLNQLLNEKKVLTQLIDMKAKMEELEKSLSKEPVSPFNVIDLQKEDYKYYNCVFACKVNNEEDYNWSINNGNSESELTEVQRIIELDSSLFAEFKANTMEYFDWLTNFGGSTCSIDLEAKYPEHAAKMEEHIDFLNLLNSNAEIKADWFKGLMQIGTLIVDRNDKKDFIISNQQGYNYSRYTAFPSNITEAPRPKTAA